MSLFEPQKPKKEWLNAAYNLMRNRKSNSAHIQFQVGVDFYHNVKDSQISEKDAHKKFVKALLCCKPLLDKIAP